MSNIVDPVAMLLKATKTIGDVLPTASDTAVPLPSPLLPNVTHQHVNHSGSLTLWVVFVIMLAASIIFTGLSWNIPVGKRLYHVITTLITITAAISYFGMATGHGVSDNKIVEKHDDKRADDIIYRQVFWARYVDWAITTPLLLLDLFLLAGSNGAVITMGIIADLIMILTGLFAAFGNQETAQKWGWYTIACIAYIFVIWHLVYNGRASAQAKGGKVGSFFTSIAGYTLILWTAYPIVWGIADGGRRVGVDGEIIAYAVLDVLAKPIFGLWLLITHSRMPETNVELTGFWTEGLSGQGRIRIGDDDEGA